MAGQLRLRLGPVAAVGTSKWSAAATATAAAKMPFDVMPLQFKATCKRFRTQLASLLASDVAVTFAVFALKLARH